MSLNLATMLRESALERLWPRRRAEPGEPVRNLIGVGTDGSEHAVAAVIVSMWLAVLFDALFGGEWVQVDVADRRSVERAVAEAGEVDLLVANAGVADNHERRPLWEIDPAEWWRIYEVDVLGVHLCCRAVIPGVAGSSPAAPIEAPRG